MSHTLVTVDAANYDESYLEIKNRGGNPSYTLLQATRHPGKRQGFVNGLIEWFVTYHNPDNARDYFTIEANNELV